MAGSTIQRSSWALFLLLYQCVRISGQGSEHLCNASLGMGDRRIPDNSITSSLEGSKPFEARLNGGGAWCFKHSETKNLSNVSLTVDLGQLALLAGIISQGAGGSYFIGFRIRLRRSAEDQVGDICCGGSNVTFYAQAKKDKKDEMTTHSFLTLVAAQYLTLEFDSSVKWPGDDEKCFRFEFVGCPQDVKPKTDLMVEALPAGWVVGTWGPPSIVNPSGAVVSLVATSYFVKIDRKGGGEEGEVLEKKLNARRVTVPIPLWGATYTITLKCVYQGFNLSCGEDFINAEVIGCDSDESSCLIQNQVMFRSPLDLQAEVVDESKVMLTWSSASDGWITSEIIVRVVDNDLEEIFRHSLTNKDESVTVTGVEGGSNYSVSFIPTANSQDLAEFSFNLYILAWDGVKNSVEVVGYGAFVTDVGLSAAILWNGTLRVTWTPATVFGVSWDEAVSSTPQTISVKENEVEDDAQIDSTSTTASSTSASSETDTIEDAIASPSPTPVESSQATAFMYTIYLSATDGEIEDRIQNVTDVSGDFIRVDLPSLKFETQYMVSIVCHFGDESVPCGNTFIYAALPIHWIVMGSDIIIHATAPGLGSWQDQEDQCRKSAGHLVSLPDSFENDKLQYSLTKDTGTPGMDTFWIGLNMCPGYGGFPWSDASSWRESNLPNENSMLSSTTCCIKAVWGSIDGVEKKFNWLGEDCGALLPAICEFHPEGMVGVPGSLSRGPANKTEASISWDYKSEYWNASSLCIEYCPTRNLMNIDTNIPADEGLEGCKTDCVESSVNEYNLTELTPFTEYNVSVRAKINELNFTGEPRITKIRTFPETPIIAEVLPSGHLRVVWAEKVANFRENEMIKVEARKSTGQGTVIFSDTVRASGVSINGLELGDTYVVTVEEQGQQRRQETTTVKAYPACPCSNCQIEGFCYIVQERQAEGFMADQKCRSNDSRLVTIEDKGQLEHLLKIAEVSRDDFWVDPDSKKISIPALDSRDTAALLTEEVEENEVFDEEIAENEKAKKICLKISRSQRAVVQEACSIMHRPACRHRAPVAPAFPPVNDFAIQRGGNGFSLDYISDSAWKSIKSVYYRRNYGSRFARSLRSQEFETPPVVVKGLELNKSYSVELVSDMGRGFVSTSGEFEVSTTNDKNSPFTDKLTVGSVPIGQNYIMQLVCCSILVAACITTMLLFFATGMFYQDCVAQLAFLGTLMAAFLNLMLAHPNPVLPESETGCIVVAVVLHYLFLCAFMFLMLESLTYAHLLVSQIRSPFQKSNWLLMAFGLLIPLLIVAVCAAVPYRKYVDYDQSNCWLNGYEAGVYGEAIPIAILVIASVILLFLTICKNETPPELIDINLRSRQSDSHKLRWVVLALVIELSVVWSTGIATYQSGNQDLRVVFCVFTLFLAITIVGARTSFDDTFRSKMHRLCCGTELTYKRSELVSLSGKSRVGPVPEGPSPGSAMTARADAKDYSTREEKTTTVIPSAEEDVPLPNTPPLKEDQTHVLIRRSYHFTDDGPTSYG